MTDRRPSLLGDEDNLESLKAALQRCYNDLAMMQRHALEMDTQLEAETKKRRALEARVKAIHTSKSWRLTSPLRGVMLGAKSLLKPKLKK